MDDPMYPCYCKILVVQKMKYLEVHLLIGAQISRG